MAIDVSDQTLRLLVERAPGAVAMFDRDMRYLAHSCGYLQDYRLEDQDILGRSHYDVFPDLPEEWKAIHRRCLAGESDAREKDPFPRADGTLDWVKWEIRPWYEDEDTIGGIILFSEVITKRLKVEDALKASEEKFRAAFSSSPDSIAINALDDGTYVEVNQGFEQLLGWTREEVLGRSSLELGIWAQPEDRARLAEGLREHGEVHKLVSAFRRKSGDIGIGQMSARIMVVDGRPCILSVTRDITLEEQARRDLLDSQESLLRSERALRAVSSVSRVLVRASSEDELLSEVCESIARTAGYPRVWVGYAHDDVGASIEPVAGAGVAADHLDQIRMDLSDGQSGSRPAGRAIATGEAVVKRNVPQDVVEQPWCDRASARGFSACAALPLRGDDGAALGVLVLNSQEGDAFDDAEMVLLREMAEDLAYGIRSLRTRQQHRETSWQLTQANLQLDELLRGLVTTMGKVVEARDPYTQGHEQEVARLSRLIATRMGLAPDQIDGIEVAALVHDIGKLACPAEILSKPTALSALERRLVEMHALAGHEILEHIEFPWPVARAVHQHHERMDGSGYPEHLTRDEILIDARIIMVADVLEAMSAHRPYRPALGVDAALAELSGHPELYDADVVAACLELHAAGELTASQS